MVLEIKLQHAWNIYTLVLIQISDFVLQSQDELKIGPVLQVRVVQFLGAHGIEIQIPSTTTTDRTSWVVIHPGKNRYVDELHLRDPGHNSTSSRLLLERSFAEESEPCSTEMEQSRIEESHATQFEIPTNPVYYSKEVILVGERKWNDSPAHKSFSGDLFKPKSQNWS